MADRIKNYQQEADQITTLKAIRTDLGVTPSSYTPDATVVTKDRVVTFAQAEEELAVLGDIEKGVKQQVAKGDIADKRITNIEKLLQGNLYDYQTDSTSAYTKSVPSGAMPYAGLEKVGGKTIVWNQLVNTGTTSVATISGHKYYTLIDGTASIVTADGTAITIVDDTVDMVCDLTLMFGSGNEPSTTADFTAIFGATHYEYNAGELLSAGVTEVKSDSKNLLDQTLFLNAVPHHTEYDGYWSVSTYWIVQKYPHDNYNSNASPVFTQPTITLSFEAKRPDVGDSTINFTVGFLAPGNVRKVYKTLSITDEWERFSVTLTGNTDPVKVYFGWLQNVVILIRNMQVEANSVATDYSPYGTIANYPIPTAIRNLEGYGWSAGDVYNYIDYERKVFVQNVGSRAYASGDESDSTVITDGTTTYYPLTTAVETDISEYLTDDNLLEVEAGGTLTFENQHGTDYRLPVPSEETYMIDLQEAINNG